MLLTLIRFLSGYSQYVYFGGKGCAYNTRVLVSHYSHRCPRIFLSANDSLGHASDEEFSSDWLSIAVLKHYDQSN